MPINYDVKVTDLSPQDREAEETEIKANPLYWQEGGFGQAEKEKLTNRLQEHYKLKHPESEERSSLQSQDKGLYDMIKKSGLTSSEQIEKESEESWGEANQTKIDQDMVACESALKAKWGSDFEQNLAFSKAFFEKIELTDLDKDWLEFSPPGGEAALANNPEFIEAFVAVGKLLVAHNVQYKDALSNFVKNWKPSRKRR